MVQASHPRRLCGEEHIEFACIDVTFKGGGGATLRMPVKQFGELMLNIRTQCELELRLSDLLKAEIEVAHIRGALKRAADELAGPAEFGDARHVATRAIRAMQSRAFSYITGAKQEADDGG
jgi:hypothetical protein